MPIDKRKSVGEIIKQEIKAGYPPAQAKAISLNAKGLSKKKNTKKQSKKKSVKKESVDQIQKPFDTLVNEYLNAFIFEDVTEPVSPTLVTKTTDEVKKRLMQKASKVNPMAVKKALEAERAAGMDKA